MPRKLSFFHSSSFVTASLCGLVLALMFMLVTSHVQQGDDGYLAQGLLAGIAILMAGFFAIGIFVVRKVNLIAKTAEDIMRTGALSHRIPITSRWDDLSQLVFMLNGMLDRIEAQVESNKRVTDHIAHDLRTPLARIRHHVEKLSDDPRKEKIADDIQQLSLMFDGLLRLAEIEKSEKTKGFETIDLVPLIEDAIELYTPVAHDRQITLKGDLQSCQIHGDRHLIFQSIANLLDNAIKYTPESGRVHILLRQDDTKVNVTICDSGPGFDNANIDDVTRPFFREDSMRHLPGLGLGLSIVHAITLLHKGQLSILPSEEGCHIRMSF